MPGVASATWGPRQPPKSSRGFNDWSASCTNNLPSVGMNGSELCVNFGHNSCSISLMGQRVTLFDWNWGRKAVNLNKIVEQIPPLSYLTRMSDILTEAAGVHWEFGVGVSCESWSRPTSEVIEVFANVAGTVVQKAMEKSTSLVQTAATSKFPAAGEPRVLHHKGSNLLIESHTQHVPARRGSGPPEEMAAVQTDARQSQAGDPPMVPSVSTWARAMTSTPQS